MPHEITLFRSSDHLEDPAEQIILLQEAYASEDPTYIDHAITSVCAARLQVSFKIAAVAGIPPEIEELKSPEKFPPADAEEKAKILMWKEFGMNRRAAYEVIRDYPVANAVYRCALRAVGNLISIVMSQNHRLDNKL